MLEDEQKAILFEKVSAISKIGTRLDIHGYILMKSVLFLVN